VVSRRVIVLACTATLLGLGIDYAHVAMTAEQGWRWCIESPTERDGSALLFPLWEVTGIDDAHHYRISKVISDIPVDGDSTGLTVGATVSIEAVFNWNDGTPIARERTIEIHRLRVWKEALGVLGFVVLSVILPFCFVVVRQDGRRFLAERGFHG
jgi:hypothetical protein